MASDEIINCKFSSSFSMVRGDVYFHLKDVLSPDLYKTTVFVQITSLFGVYLTQNLYPTIRSYMVKFEVIPLRNLIVMLQNVLMGQLTDQCAHI